ncbi:hypothetical protein C0213_04055 [Latilactobacillus sakei]|nr:hypothetical protein C0213_04055 [Latilactobacillus sakei]
MQIKDIYGLQINEFRKFINQDFELGNNLTVVFGRNGTLKSSLMGLIAQPFRTDARDIFNKKMETKLSDVFKFSLDKDNTNYLYHIKMNINDDLNLNEPIPLYPEKDPTTGKVTRFRLVPSGRASGDGYFNLPSIYSKLDRLYPLVDFKKEPQKNDSIEYTQKEIDQIAAFFESILLRTDFSSSQNYNAQEGRVAKHPIAPTNSYYDINSISSGEDNLSSFINTMLSFQRLFEVNKENKLTQLTGIWSIDEFEASLHPIAQNNLLKYLLNWSKEYKVKIILNTHSLSLIQYSYELLDKYKNSIALNLISSAFASEGKLNILKNPPYKDAYRELTLSDVTNDELAQSSKITIFCEDKVAKNYLKIILSERKYQKYITWEFEVSPSNSGSSYVLLDKLCSNYPNVLNKIDAIVISDADRRNKISSHNSFKRHYAVPSLFEFPIEKEVVYWILSLDSDHEFFKRFDRTKEMFKQDFHNFNLPLDPEQSKKENTPTKYFKNWYNNDVQTNKKYIRMYVKQNNNLFDPFKKTIYSDIKEIMKNNGFTIN